MSESVNRANAEYTASLRRYAGRSHVVAAIGIVGTSPMYAVGVTELIRGNTFNGISAISFGVSAAAMSMSRVKSGIEAMNLADSLEEAPGQSE